MTETGREEVEQREKEKGLAEKGAQMQEKGVGKEAEVGNGRDTNVNWKKKRTENVNEGARN